MHSPSTDPTRERVLALTREIPNYADRLAREVGCPESELWALYLAATGRMLYPQQVEGGMRFPEGPVPGTTLTRYSLWRTALEAVIGILGPVELRLRLGDDPAEVHASVIAYFSGGSSPR